MATPRKNKVPPAAPTPKIPDHWLGKIHQRDCVETLKQTPDACVHLAFADPPFNIGYEYDDRIDSEKYLEWSRIWMANVKRVLSPSGAAGGGR